MRILVLGGTSLALGVGVLEAQSHSGGQRRDLQDELG